MSLLKTLSKYFLIVNTLIICVIQVIIASSKLSRVPAICANVTGLLNEQLRVCEDNPIATLAASEGTRMGILECQNQFKNERWNCTPEGDQQVFGHTLLRGKLAFFYLLFL